MASESEFSELTDLESDSYEDTKKKKTTVNAKKDAGGYRIRNALKVPRATTYTAQALYDQIHNMDINLEPEYQRDVVWPEAKQIGIIDSVFRNFYIPPVIFAVNSSEDGSETKTCIDGKQRLTSIHRFMDGLIPHKDPITGEKLWYKDVEKAKSARARKILPEKYRRLFANKQIVCVEYQDITDSDEREIFQRVQLGMALTPAEKLQVINTPRASFIRELQATHLKEEGGLAGDALEWDRSRGADFRCLAQTVYCIEKWSGGIKNAGTISQLEKWLSLEDPLPSQFRAKMQDTFHTFSSLVQDKRLNRVFKKPAKVSPVEFIFIGVLVAVHKDAMSLSQLASAVEFMRDHVRDTHVDIRMNNRVAKTMIDYIKGLKAKNVKQLADGLPAAERSEGLKRKRAVEDEEEFQPKAKKPSATASTSFSAKAKSSASTAKTTPTPKPSQKPAPSTAAVPDRIAVLRAAKSAHPPSGPRKMMGSSSAASTSTLSSASTSTAKIPLPSLPPHPHSYLSNPNGGTPSTHLPSPAQSFSSSSFTQQQQQQNALETSLMASMMRQPSGAAPMSGPAGSGGGGASRHDYPTSSVGGGGGGSVSYDSDRDRGDRGDLYHQRGNRESDRDRGVYTGPPPDSTSSASSYGGGGVYSGRKADSGWPKR